MKQLSRSTRAFTLVEIMIVVAIIALLAAIAVPSLLRAYKRSQASAVLNDLRMIDAAVEQFAVENNKLNGASVAISQWKKYLKEGSRLQQTGRDIFGQAYPPQIVGRLPRVGGAAQSALAGVVDESFWAPYEGTAAAAAAATSVADLPAARAETPPQ